MTIIVIFENYDILAKLMYKIYEKDENILPF